jgi:hypothetical protein
MGARFWEYENFARRQKRERSFPVGEELVFVISSSAAAD